MLRCRALACDYDGTLATNSVVDSATTASLRKWVAAGRKLLLVTGRELPELKVVLPELDLFDYVVAENGGLLYLPASGEIRTIAAPPPPEFVDELVARRVAPISVGHSIVATWQPHETTVLEVIQQMGFELQVIFNKGAVMILPSGVNKASGLAAALNALELSRHSVVAVGDAENDHAFFQFCRIGVAVDNALPALKQRAELVTEGDHGHGVQQLIERLLSHDLSDVPTPQRHQIELTPGRFWLPGEEHLLITYDEPDLERVGDSLALRLATKGYQYCHFTCAAPKSADVSAAALTSAAETVVGTSEQLPTASDVVQNLARPDQNLRVALGAHGVEDRRQRFAEIMTKLRQLIDERGRPHVVCLPPPQELASLGLQAEQLVQGLPSVVVWQEATSPAPQLPANHHTLRAIDWLATPTVIAAP